jgi:hypothetical protein
MKRLALCLMLVLALFIVLGCQGGTSGSATGSSHSCSGGGGSGSCDGRIGKLSGTISEEFETSSGADYVDVEATVSSESGIVRMWVMGPNDEKPTVEAGAGASATLKGQAEVSFDAFKVYFQAVDGTASGVKYTLTHAAR